jgi:hypothetical protein
VRLMRKAAKVVAAILLISAALVVAPNSLALGAPQEIDLRIDELNQLQVEIDELQRNCNPQPAQRSRCWPNSPNSRASSRSPTRN